MCDRDCPCEELRDDVSELRTDDDRRKNENRDVGVGATAVVGVPVTADRGGESVAGAPVAAEVEKLLSIGGKGDEGVSGFSIPINFMVAFNRSRSLRSSSSSCVSNFRAPVTTGVEPALRVSGRRFGVGSGFFSVPLNIEKLLQSKDMDLLEARPAGGFV